MRLTSGLKYLLLDNRGLDRKLGAKATALRFESLQAIWICASPFDYGSFELTGAKLFEFSLQPHMDDSAATKHARSTDGRGEVCGNMIELVRAAIFVRRI
jgi:hypothetical protein